MSRPILHFALVIALAAPLLALFPAKPSPADPDFSKIGDILSGKRRLFPVDDLVVSQFDSTGKLVHTIVQTKDGGLASQESYTNLPNPGNYATGIGRMFKLPRDVVVTVVKDFVVIRDQNPNGAVTRTFPLNVSGTPNLNQFPRADFTGDGFADFAYLVDNNIYILTAKNVESIDDGLFYSQAGAAPFDLTNKWAVLAASDFDGDGTPEVALAAAQNNDVTVTIYTVSVARDSQGRLTKISLAPSGSATFTIPSSTNLEMAMVAGVYSGALNPETTLPLSDLVLMYKYTLFSVLDRVDLRSLQVEVASTNPTVYSIAVADTESWGATDNGIWKISMVSDHLNFFGDSQQIVAAFTETPGEYAHLAVFTLDSNLNIYKPREQIFSLNDADAGFYSVAVGNFDQEIEQNQPIQLEIALLYYYAGLPGFDQAQIWLFRVDPSNNYALSPIPGGNVQFSGPPGGSYLMAGDTQGRSLLLGNPTKLTTSITQPEVILGTPPMHVDWITPAGGMQPEVLNLSAAKNFGSTFMMEQTQGQQFSQESTTSVSNSTTETEEASYSYGVPDVSSVTVEEKFSATQEWENSVSKKYDTYSKSSFTMDTTTVGDDHLWYKMETQNIYIYPVIGRYVCPAKNPPQSPPTPLCSPSELVQLNVMFSGPSNISRRHADAARVEWYQPVHEPYNVLSYPWNLQQLQNQLHGQNMDLLSSPWQFYTDGAETTQKVQWSAGSGNAVTVGSAQNFSWDTTVSIKGNTELFGGEISGSASFSYNRSESFSTLNSSTLTADASTGIGINQPGTFATPDLYMYLVGPYIFGTKPNPAAIQQLDLGTDVQTNGILRAAFTADPTDSTSGSWWATHPYSQPDVALNHPARWDLNQTGITTPPPNCLLVQPGQPGTWCASFNPPTSNPDDVWTSEFFWMKGLLITPKEANGRGPQFTRARAGDKVLLQARVYNYSMTDMPPGATVQVRFYGQPWDETTQQPAGDAFLIDQVSHAPIPAFNSQSNQGTLPNWVLVSTDKLDTAAHADQYLAFWVLVWMQDAQGNLIGEMPGHGLTQLPGTLTSITDATGLLEAYSNNVGLYTALFYIAPPNAEGVTRASIGTEDLRLDRIRLSKRIALLGEEVIVRANVHAQDDHDHFTALFYDGNPDQGSKAFEHETIPHVRGGSFYQLRVLYEPEECGVHDIYLDIHPGGLRTHTKLYVTIDPRSILSDLSKHLQPSDASISPSLLPQGLQGKALSLLRSSWIPTGTFASGMRGDDPMMHLQTAQKLFEKGDNASALASLEQFKTQVRNQRGKSLSGHQAQFLLDRIEHILTCLPTDRLM
ncbi:MAG TPA: VCBS repeat-containing protein [Methylococcus sp.]|nr:VCBS repeat-containing protein [Methylococcus sp.]